MSADHIRYGLHPMLIGGETTLTLPGWACLGCHEVTVAPRVHPLSSPPEWFVVAHAAHRAWVEHLLWEDDVSDGRMTDAGRADAISRFRSMVYGAERRGDLQSAGFYAVVANELEAQQADLAALTATCAALSEEKAQEVERRLRAEAELDERRSRVAKIRSNPMCAYGCSSPTFVEAALAAGWDGRESTFDACLQKTWLEHVRTCPNHPQRKVESDRDNALALKRTAYDVLNGCRKVVGETIIPALEALERRLAECAHSLPGGTTPERVLAIAGAVPVDTSILRAQLVALAAARKLLED